MRAVLWLLALAGVAVALALLTGGNQSTVTVFWAPYRVDLSLNLVLLLLILFFVVLHMAWRAMSSLLALPQQARRWRLQQKERSMYVALLEALAQLWSGRYVRSVKSAEKVLTLSHALGEEGDTNDVSLRHAQQLRAVAHLVAAESAHALRNREARAQHLQAVVDLRDTPVTDDTVAQVLESAHLNAARWALSDRDASQALHWLDGLQHGPARRMLALRLRLKATRLNQQHHLALETARLLAKHGAFTEAAAQSLLRELAIASLNDARDAAQLQRAWDALEPAERGVAEVTLHAAQRMLALSEQAEVVMPWLTPLWNRVVQQPEAYNVLVRDRLAQTLANALMRMPADAQWLSSIERAQLAQPRWTSLLYLAGMVYWHHALWGKAQQMLEQASVQLRQPEMQRHAWRSLAQLAEQKGDAVRAQACLKRAAEVT